MKQKGSHHSQAEDRTSMADRERTEEVSAFFDMWNIYRKTMLANYYGHREVYRILTEILRSEFKDGFSILDLGCGDAERMAALLADTAVREYRGVDLSKIALALARENIAILTCERSLVLEDFLELTEKADRPVDVIWTGLSLHHLPLNQKRRFFASLSRALTARGRLIIFEPVMRDSETREDHFRRWRAACEAGWNALAQDEMESLSSHIFSSDYPETLATYQELGDTGGFPSMDVLFEEPNDLYALISFRR